MALPGTIPPPSTRSNSLNPLVKRGVSCKLISESVWIFARVSPAYPLKRSFFVEFEAEINRTSLIVFHALQAEHCPCQRENSAPQSLHT